MAKGKDAEGASSLRSFKTCPRMYYFDYRLNLRQRKFNDKLAIGTGFHIGVGVYYANNFNRPLAEMAMEVWADQMRADAYEMIHTDGTMTGDELDAMISMSVNSVRRYLDFAELNDDFKVILVEQEFDLPVWIGSNPIDTARRNKEPKGQQRILRGTRHKGTIDMIVQSPDGRLWVVEHKTAAAFPSLSQLEIDDQLNLYVLAAKQMFNLDVAGVMYNVTKKIKDEKRTRSEFVQRIMIPKNRESMLATRDNLYHTCMRIRRDNDHLIELMCPGMHCSWMCAYKQLCSAIQEGLPWKEIANYMYEVKDRDTDKKWENRIEDMTLKLYAKQNEGSEHSA